MRGIIIINKNETMKEKDLICPLFSETPEIDSFIQGVCCPSQERWHLY